jgi:ferredoxin
MATPSLRFPQNAPGRFYTTAECIDCDICRETAPASFRRDDDLGYSVVYRQPATPEEDAQAREAMHGCPVEAIGCADAP